MWCDGDWSTAWKEQRLFITRIVAAVVVMVALTAVLIYRLVQLQVVDYQHLMSEPGKPRWYNTAQWARNSMVNQGLLKKNSPRGIWEISTKGREYLEKVSQTA